MHSATRMEPDAYMEAFMNGYEFVLLAIRGRLAEQKLSSAERMRLEAFLADYSRIAEAYRDRRAAPEPAGLLIRGAMHAEILPAMAN